MAPKGQGHAKHDSSPLLFPAKQVIPLPLPAPFIAMPLFSPPCQGILLYLPAPAGGAGRYNRIPCLAEKKGGWSLAWCTIPLKAPSLAPNPDFRDVDLRKLGYQRNRSNVSLSPI